MCEFFQGFFAVGGFLSYISGRSRLRCGGRRLAEISIRGIAFAVNGVAKSGSDAETVERPGLGVL
jgi:hypothetical protein